jgi:predicted methyltransferase
MASLLKAVVFAQNLLASVITDGSTVVDATAGKGYDTAFLARLVGENGKVYAFDIQQQALSWTEERLLNAGLNRRVQLFHVGHECMLQHIEEPVQAVMFNLGYLPGVEHDVITRPDTTVKAVQAALELLIVGGMLTVVAYPGHAGGEEELQCLETYVAGLPQKQFMVIRYQILNQVNKPPLVIAIEKIG